jgi:hypothetical protein
MRERGVQVSVTMAMASVTLVLATVSSPNHALAQLTAYNPYADSQEMLPPVAPDGTLRWGTFYKSAALQKTYERLWNLGACRGTNKAITVPVEQNKLSIDALEEQEFRGTVIGATGSLEGGMLAFATAQAGPDAAPFVAALHPAGVSKLTVTGSLPAARLRPGMTVRVNARVDRKGVCAEPVDTIDVVTLPAQFKPAAVRADQVDTIVGQVVLVRSGMLQVRVPAGTIRRVTLPLAPESLARFDAAQLDIVEPGDTVAITGRLWDGEGCMGQGTVFASKVSVTKAVGAAPVVDATKLGAR